MNELNKILNTFLMHYKDKIFIFGSRSIGDNRVNSDLDIFIDDNSLAVKGSTVSHLEEALEKSNIPCKVDVVFRSRITDDFYKSIQYDLKKIDEKIPGLLE